MTSLNLRYFLLAVLFLVLTQTLRNEIIFEALLRHELKKSSNYKDQLLKLNSHNFTRVKEKKNNKEIINQKRIVNATKINENENEIIPIIDGTHVDRLPRFWQTDRPWTVGFSGGKCGTSEYLVLINSAPKNLDFRQVQRQYLKRQLKRFKMEYKFLLGEKDEALDSENKKFGDLVFGDHKDSYVMNRFLWFFQFIV